MDSELTESVVHVDDLKTWTDAVFASFRPTDRHVSDDEIFEILNAGSHGEAAAELFAAKGVTVPMYCVWKAKYRHMTLEEVRAARRLELWRARALVAVFVAVAGLSAGGIVLALGRVAQSNNAAATEATPPVPVKFAPPPAESPKTVNTSSPAMPEPVAPAVPVALAPPTEAGYKIQVAAAASLEEGRTLLERLASAGYPAYLSRAVVNNTEVFRVRVGPFDDLPAAEDIASQLKRDGFSGAWIAR